MKDIVVEQDVNPEVDKPSKKKQLDVGAGKDASAPAMDWDSVSIPLEPRGPGKIGFYCVWYFCKYDIFWVSNFVFGVLDLVFGKWVKLYFGSREAEPQRRQR